MGQISVEIAEVLFERRILSAVSVLCGVGVLTFLIALATDFWFVVVVVNEEDKSDLLWSHAGLWRVCHVYRDAPLTSNCAYHGLDEDMSRVLLPLCVVLLFLIALSAAFAVYSLRHPRYTFKRVAGSLLLLTALTTAGFASAAKADQRIVDKFYQDVEFEHEFYYGYSYLLAWIAFIIFIVASISFFGNSKKRKLLPFDHEHNLH